jgi:hypothetical protein
LVREGALVVMGPALLGNSQVTVTQASVGPVEANGIDPKTKLLSIQLKITNTSPTQKVFFYGWGINDSINEKSPPQLFDSMGNALKRINLPVGTLLKGQTDAATLKTGESATDVLVFAAPSADSLFVKLVLGGPGDQREGRYRVLIPRDRIQRATAPPPADPVKPKPPDKPKPEEPQLPPALKALVEHLSNEKPEVRAAALAKLLEMKDAALPAIKEISNLLGSQDESIRVGVLKWLEGLGPKAAPAATLLAARLSSENKAEIRAQVATLLGVIGADAKEAVNALRTALQDTDPEVQKQAKEALKLIQGQK